MRAFLVVLLAIFATACSKADADRTAKDMKAATADIKNDPAVKRTAADLKVAARDAGAEIRKGAAKAGDELKKAGGRLKKTGEDARSKAPESANGSKDRAAD